VHGPFFRFIVARNITNRDRIGMGVCRKGLSWQERAFVDAYINHKGDIFKAAHHEGSDEELILLCAKEMQNPNVKNAIKERSKKTTQRPVSKKVTDQLAVGLFEERMRQAKLFQASNTSADRAVVQPIRKAAVEELDAHFTKKGRTK
jgi:hypothetical protein